MVDGGTLGACGSYIGRVDGKQRWCGLQVGHAGDHSHTEGGESEDFWETDVSERLDSVGLSEKLDDMFQEAEAAGVVEQARSAFFWFPKPEGQLVGDPQNSAAYEVFSCRLCGALVVYNDRTKHQQWHGELDLKLKR